MFSAEQEAQLTKWGCPGRFTQQISDRFTVADKSELDLPGYDHPRQPHDVLAWLSAAYNTMTEIGCNGGVTWHCRIYGIPARNAGYPDPYSAVYALAQAVMEAK